LLLNWFRLCNLFFGLGITFQFMQSGKSNGIIFELIKMTNHNHELEEMPETSIFCIRAAMSSSMVSSVSAVMFLVIMGSELSSFALNLNFFLLSIDIFIVIIINIFNFSFISFIFFLLIIILFKVIKGNIFIRFDWRQTCLI